VEKPVDSVDNFSVSSCRRGRTMGSSGYPQKAGYTQGVIHSCG